MIKYASAALCGLLASAGANAVDYTRVVPERSSVAFVSKQMGVGVDGSFRKFSMRLAFDPAKPEAGKAQVDIDVASIDAGGPEANDEVKSRNWFDVKQFPTASFVSSAVKPLGGGRYEVRGQMSIKGRTQEVAAPFVLRQDGANALLEGSFVMKRLDFGIGSGTWGDTSVVADEVQVKFRFAIAPKS